MAKPNFKADRERLERQLDERMAREGIPFSAHQWGKMFQEPTPQAE